VRVAAIGCMGDSTDDLPFLLEQVRAKAKDVRAAALKALARCGADEAARVLSGAIGHADLALAVEALRQTRHPVATGVLLDEAEKQFNALIAGKEKDAKKLGPQNERMGLLLQCLEGREDARTEKLLLTMFEHIGRLAAIKGTPSGNDVVERLVSVMATGPPVVQSALIDAHGKLPAESLGEAMAAARRSRAPAEVFANFSPYLTARVDGKKKDRAPAWAKREAIIGQLTGVGVWAPDAEESSASADLDPRWLDLAVGLGNADLVRELAVPGHTGAIEFLAALFRQGMSKSGKEYELFEVLGTMARVDHPGATDAVIELIQKLARAKSPYGYYGLSYWIGRLIPKLPRAEALPKLEAILPTLPEGMVDQLLDSVTELKQATTTAAST
jgi:hypothetical protein